MKVNASRLITNDNLKAEIEEKLKDINLINRLRLGHISGIALEKLVIISFFQTGKKWQGYSRNKKAVRRYRY
ncbi:hypothetical protein ES695_01035 [Candidatus Atribacteria bacterium 1244-E10-H5-B2]|nr:MAG: hypothetical protein ES695_01035 [Candidatus Atribacteria bacterium 1244-E10-H5-B2]